MINIYSVMMYILINLFYYVLQWYFVLLLALKTTDQPIASVHNQLGHLQTLLCVYLMVYKDDTDKAYIIAISYYIFDMMQMILLQYRRNLMQHIIFTLHHVGTIYVMILDNDVFQAIVYKLELSNIALVLYYYLKDITWCKLYLQILQFCWYSYFRIFSVIPHFYEILLLRDYEIYCLYLFYMMGVYWSLILMYRIIVE